MNWVLPAARIVGSALFAVALVRVAFAQDVPPPEGTLDTISVPPRPAPNGCPNLDSRLGQLAASADPDAFAGSAGLDYADGTVRVVVELAGSDSPDTDTYGLIPEGQYANLVQTRVPPDQLCALASDPAVLAVRPPSVPVLDN
jgi:hypothetical protein